MDKKTIELLKIQALFSNNLIETIENLNEEIKANKEIDSHSKKIVERKTTKLNDFGYLLNDIVATLYSPDTLNKNLGDDYMMKEERTGQHYVIKPLDVLNKISNLKTDLNRTSDIVNEDTERIKQRDITIKGLKNSIEHEMSKNKKLKIAIEGFEMYVDIQARKASKSNAEKGILLGVLNSFQEHHKTNMYKIVSDDILHEYKRELRQRRKKKGVNNEKRD